MLSCKHIRSRLASGPAVIELRGLTWTFSNTYRERSPRHRIRGNHALCVGTPLTRQRPRDIYYERTPQRLN